MGVVQLSIPNVRMREHEMQLAFYMAFNTRYELVADNLYLGWSGGEMDIFGLRKSGFIDEIEIKLSASDFKADFKKTINTPRWTGMGRNKHKAIESGVHSCNYFSFFIPADLVDKCDIPDYAGLYVFDVPGSWNKVREVKKAPRLHTRKISDANKYKTARKMHYRYWDIRRNKHKDM